MMATIRKSYTNRQHGIKCAMCEKEIAIGARKTWERSGKVSRNWHIECTPKDGIAVTDGGTDDETESENQTDFESTETNQTKRHDNGAAINGAADWMQGLAGAMLPFLEGRLATKLDKTEVESIIKKMLDGAVLMTAHTVKIEDFRGNKQETYDAGLQHERFPRLMQILQCKVNLWLTGPAGGGKTKAVENAATSLGKRFYHIGAMDTEYKLMGFIDARGEVVSTEFRKWWQNGGVLCLDEIDSWLPAASLSLNAALANGHCTFPDGRIDRHPECIAVACANTYGNGPSTDYVGRAKHDAAFLDRFVMWDWPYDEGLEIAIAGNPQWTRKVQKFRAKAKAKGLKVIISPRASIYGAELLAGGVPEELVEELAVKKGMTAEQWGSIQ